MKAPAARLLAMVLAAHPLRAQDAPAAPPTNQRPLLTLAAVLERGRDLEPRLPTVLWQPEGHVATVVVTAADGSQALHHVADGRIGEPIVEARALRAAIGATSAGPARMPDVRWLDATTLRVEHDRTVFHWRPGVERCEPVLSWPEPQVDDRPLQRTAPDDGHVAYVRDDQLWLRYRDGRVRQLTFDGSADVVYGSAAHRAEFGIASGLFHSKDGRYLCFSREDRRPIEPYPYQDLGALPPRPVPGRYPMAGRQHARVRLAVCDTTDGSVHWLEGDADADVYWTNVTFGSDDTLVVALVNRGQDHLRLVRFDCKTGRRLAVLVEEHDPEWIEPLLGPSFLTDGRFLWRSPRNGNHHLWLFGADGALQGQVTKGAFDVQRLLGVGADGRTVWFEASGEDPRQLHLFAAALDGSEVRQITRERGTHLAELSPDFQQAAVVWSNLETPPSVRLVDLASGAATPLPSGDDPLAAYALPAQRLFQIKAEDDTVLYGHVALPPDLAEGKRFPVLLYVYGGPQVQLVTDRWFGGAPLWLQALAAEGYVVCRLDNRGTPHRGIAFEQVVHRRLGVLEVQDQLAAVEWCKQQPWADPERIGVHGWSYGGYMTLRLMLAAPTTFACGVSGAPVTDWRLYETGYTERYMDMPAENEGGYELSSCLPFADRLQRPLLVVHGTDDRTVVWAHTLKFVDRCVATGKQLDYLPYPGQQHRLEGQSRVHFLRLLRDWLARHLKEPAKAK